MAKIDIIIPAFNCSDYLDECLASLVAQSFAEWCAILVDDGSTDNKTPQLCDLWSQKDRRIEVFHLPNNKGVANARNHGLRLSQADLVTFLDSDDFLLPNHLQSLYNALQNSEADVAMCGLRHVYDNGKWRKYACMLKAGTLLEQPAIFFEASTDSIVTSHLCNKLFKRTLLEEIVFPTGKTYEDFAIMLDIVRRAKRIVHTGEATYAYRRTPSSITHTVSEKNLLDYFYAARQRLQQIKDFPLLTDFEKASLAVWPLKTMTQAYRKMRLQPASEQKDSALREMLYHLAQLNIPPACGLFWLKMMLYSLEKRLFTRSFRRRHGSE